MALQGPSTRGLHALGGSSSRSSRGGRPLASGRAGPRPSSTSSSVAARAGGDWRNNVGPSASYMEGDREYIETSQRLSATLPGFAPTQPQYEEGVEEEVGAASSSSSHDGSSSSSSSSSRRRTARDRQRGWQPTPDVLVRPEFGLSPRQIAALGLSGPRLGASLPDSVGGLCMRVLSGGGRCGLASAYVHPLRACTRLPAAINSSSSSSSSSSASPVRSRRQPASVRA